MKRKLIREGKPPRIEEIGVDGVIFRLETKEVSLKKYGTTVDQIDGPASNKIYAPSEVIMWLKRSKPEIVRIWKSITPVYKENQSLSNLKKACLEWSDQNPESVLKREYFEDEGIYLFRGKSPEWKRLKEIFIVKLCQIIISDFCKAPEYKHLKNYLPLPQATDKRNSGIEKIYKLYRMI